MILAINDLGMYTRFKRDGWTTTLARQTTKRFIPTIIHAVELAWLEAYSIASKEVITRISALFLVNMAVGRLMRLAGAVRTPCERASTKRYV